MSGLELFKKLAERFDTGQIVGAPMTKSFPTPITWPASTAKNVSVAEPAKIAVRWAPLRLVRKWRKWMKPFASDAASALRLAKPKLFV